MLNRPLYPGMRMSVSTFYLETSVLGSLAPRQPRDRKQIVQRLLRLLDGARGLAVISYATLIAAATCFQLDYLVSWNHRHMTRPKKRLQYESVNRLHGYIKTPMICNPFEAFDELRNR